MPVRSLVTPRLGSIVAIAALAVSAIGAVVATRTTTPPNILVVKTGTGGGTVVADVGLLNCGATCTDLVPTGTLVTLLATPNLDSQFVGWLGPCTGRGLCTFQAGSAKTMTAAFAP